MIRHVEAGAIPDKQIAGVTATPVFAEAWLNDKERIDYANLPTPQLRDAFWTFVSHRLAPIAAALANISRTEEEARPVIQGDLVPLVAMAYGLAKAHGRNVSVGDLKSDVPDVACPPGYSPHFLLYLQAAGIKRDDVQDKATNVAIRKSLRKRIAEIRASGG
jgi:hypothetical protein